MLIKISELGGITASSQRGPGEAAHGRFAASGLLFEDHSAGVPQVPNLQHLFLGPLGEAIMQRPINRQGLHAKSFWLDATAQLHCSVRSCNGRSTTI